MSWRTTAARDCRFDPRRTSADGAGRSATRGMGAGWTAGRETRGACAPLACRNFVVGLPGFEPGTSASRTQRAAKLRHSPMTAGWCPERCG